EAAVGDQRDIIAEPAPLQRGGDAEHLAHAGTADRAFAADHDDVARRDAATRHGVERRFLAVEHLGRAFEAEIPLPGELHHAAFGREIAVADAEPAARLERLVDADDHLLPRRFGGS